MQEKPKNKFPRKTQKAGHFIIDNYSALSEYLRFKPKAIISVSASPKIFAQIQIDFPEQLKYLKLQQTTEDKLIAEVNHQTIRLNEYFAQNNNDELILALDHITDPHNLGAIVRSAAFFGIKAVVAAQDRQALFSDVSVNVARGGFAHCQLIVEANLAQTLTKLKDSGYWILGADLSGQSLDPSQRKIRPCVLVLGSEHKGLSALVQKKCDLLVKIAGNSSLDSLNVSASAAILCAYFSGAL